MPLPCNRHTSGGKGNLGKFIERDPLICAAGVPSAQATESVGDALQHYLLKDHADALLSDAIVPPPKPRPLLPLRYPVPPDMRNSGPFGAVAHLVNPRNKSKFKCLVDDLKETSYSSYWNKPLGEVRDPIPMLPEGFDINGTTFGKVTLKDADQLYDIITPKVPLPDKTPPSKEAGVQVKRNYCSPPFSKDLTYGYRTHIDKRGIYSKCCLTDDKIVLGTGDRAIVSTIQSSFIESHHPTMGEVLAPNHNIDYVPNGYSFGILKPPDKISECLTFCEINKEQEFFRTCIKHLNTIRKGLSTRFLPSFFQNLYLNLKYYDKDHTGWLPKSIVYDFCGTKLIRFDPVLMEPLLTVWHAFDGSRIEYKTFVRVINYREHPPKLPKMHDLPEDCLDFRTTYNEMVKPGKQRDTGRMAGLPSGRYFDLDYPIIPDRLCKADLVCLPQESDGRSCLNPSVLTQLFVSHRDLYQKREPSVVRRVFEAAGEKFTDKRFNAIWEEAKQLHSQGWVCFETFRLTLDKHPNVSEFEEEENNNK